MSLIAPFNFVFAGLLGLILLLYVLRLKRREHVVPSTLLWDTSLRDLQANAPWQKLRSSLLMWLQLLFLVLAILALVRPAIQLFANGGQTVAIVLDTSGSMAATDVGPSRFERARAESTRLVNALASGDSATIIAAGHRTRVLAPLTTDKAALKKAVTSATTSDTGCDLREAIVLAASLLRSKRNPQIYVLSDGAVPPLQELDTGNTGLQFVKVGQAGSNLALTVLDARRGYSGSDRAQIFATLTNFSNQPRQVNLELGRDGSLVEVRPVTVAAATKNASGDTVPGQSSELFEDLPYNAGLFSARFDLKDDLLTDNVAYARLDPPRALKVLLTADNLFLERALNVDPNVRLYRAQNNNEVYDVVVCDGSVPPNLPSANQLLFNTQTELAPVQVSGRISGPSVADYDRRHPVSRNAPWNDIRFGSAQAAKLKPWGQAVVEGETSPLIVAGEKGGKRVIWAGFDLRETDLPLRVAFPIFITNALQWLTAPRGSADGLQNGNTSQRAGQPVALDVPLGARQVTITRPDKSSVRLQVRDDGEQLIFDGADKVGLYTATSGKWQQTFAVSLLSRSESDLAPRNELRREGQSAFAANNRARANHELWGYLVVLALLILMAEWWIFHRGA